eukprot:1160454_1
MTSNNTNPDPNAQPQHVTLTPIPNGKTHPSHNMLMEPPPSHQIQQLAQRQMESMNPALKQYKEFQLQQQLAMQVNALAQQQQQQHQQQQSTQDEQRDPSDLDNTNLYVKGLWKDCTQIELDDLFKQFGVISQSRVYGDGVGFVRFEKGHEAKAALEQMNGAKLERCQDPLLVKYAFRKQKNSKRYIRVGDEVKQYEVEMIMNKNTNNVYLRCLPRNYTEQKLTQLCTPYGELTCTRLRESGVAFVRFRRAEDAQKAIRGLNGRRFENHNETLLAKLANSDPFQPKIDFKQRNEDKENMANQSSQPSQEVNTSQYSATNTSQRAQQQQQQQQPPQSAYSTSTSHHTPHHSEHHYQQQQQQPNQYNPPQNHPNAYEQPQHPPPPPQQHYPGQNPYERAGPPHQYPPVQQPPPNYIPGPYGHPPPYAEPHPNHAGYPPYPPQGAPHAYPPQYYEQPPGNYIQQPPNAPQQQQPAVQIPYAVQPVPYYTYYGGAYGGYPQYVVHAPQQQPPQPQQPPPPQQQQQQQVQPPVIVSPPQSISAGTQPPQPQAPIQPQTSLTGAPVYVPQPGAKIVAQVPSKVMNPTDVSKVSTNATVSQLAAISQLAANAVVYEPDITPPPAVDGGMSELSFRHQGKMDLNMAGLAISTIAPAIATAQANIAIPATPTLPEFEKLVQDKHPIPLQIVDEGQKEEAEDLVPGLPNNNNTHGGAMGPMNPLEKKKSNPHNVSKHYANKLHEVISTWYPQQAGKLTGMFLQNHDEEKVIKYLGRQDRLRKKIDAFASLLAHAPTPHGAQSVDALQLRLKQEIKDLEAHPIPNCSVETVDHMKLWKVTMMGSNPKLYDGDMYCLEIKIPSQFPMKPPQVTFITKMRHPNVGVNGSVDLDMLREDHWSADCTIKGVLLAIIKLLSKTNEEAEEEQKVSWDERKVSQWVNARGEEYGQYVEGFIDHGINGRSLCQCGEDEAALSKVFGKVVSNSFHREKLVSDWIWDHVFK